MLNFAWRISDFTKEVPYPSCCGSGIGICSPLQAHASFCSFVCAGCSAVRREPVDFACEPRSSGVVSPISQLCRPMRSGHHSSGRCYVHRRSGCRTVTPADFFITSAPLCRPVLIKCGRLRNSCLPGPRERHPLRRVIELGEMALLMQFHLQARQLCLLSIGELGAATDLAEHQNLQHFLLPALESKV